MCVTWASWTCTVSCRTCTWKALQCDCWVQYRSNLTQHTLNCDFRVTCKFIPSVTHSRHVLYCDCWECVMTMGSRSTSSIVEHLTCVPVSTMYSGLSLTNQKCYCTTGAIVQLELLYNWSDCDLFFFFFLVIQTVELVSSFCSCLFIMKL